MRLWRAGNPQENKKEYPTEFLTFFVVLRVSFCSLDRPVTHSAEQYRW